MKRIIFTLILIGLLAQFAFARGKIDSLLVVLQNSAEDTSMVKALEQLSWEYHRTHPEKTIYFSKRGLEIAKKLKYNLGIIKAKNILAVGYSIHGQQELAILNFKEAIELAESSNDFIHICRTYNNLGRTYMKIEDFDNAVHYYQKGAKCSNQFGLRQQTSDNLLNMATALQEQGIWDTSLKYAEEALSLAKVLKNDNLICDAHKIIGINYLNQINYDDAIKHLKIALRHAEANRDKVGISSIFNQLGKVYSKKNLSQKALVAHRNAYTTSIEINYQEQTVFALESLANIYFNQRQYSKSIEKSMEGIQIAKNLGSLKTVTILYELLAKNYAAQQDFPNAYIYHTKLKEISDSLSVLEKNQKLNELKVQFQVEHKEAENKLLKAQQSKDQLTIQKATLASTAIVIALIAVCLIAFLLYKGYKTKQIQSSKLVVEVNRRTQELEKTNADLKKSNKEMERFNHIASHDLKEPLRNIISFTRLLEMRLKNQDDTVAHEYLSFVVTNAKQMNTLIEDVLEFSKVSDKKIEIETVDLSKIFQQVLTTLQPLMEEKTVHILCESLPIIQSNGAQIYIMMRNIIENGIIYNNHPTPIIELDYQAKDNHHLISITDNGIGIDEDYHLQIFDMFKRLQSRQEAKGSGLGLSVCKKIVQRLGGDITLKSIPEKGSTFTIKIPIQSATNKNSAVRKNQPIFKVLST